MTELGAQESRALAGHLWMRDHRVDLLQSDDLGADQRVPYPQQRLRDDLDVGGVLGEQVERDADRPIERVLDRDDRPLDLARA